MSRKTPRRFKAHAGPLVVTRRLHEQIVVSAAPGKMVVLTSDGGLLEGIIIEVAAIGKTQVRIAVVAPGHQILRSEMLLGYEEGKEAEEDKDGAD